MGPIEDTITDLRKRALLAYKQSKAERRGLYRECYEANQGDDVFIEAELFGDEVSAAASWLVSPPVPTEQLSHVKEVFEKNALFRSSLLADFVLHRESEYPLCCAHLLWVECLRSACLLAVQAEETRNLSDI